MSEFKTIVAPKPKYTMFELEQLVASQQEASDIINMAAADRIAELQAEVKRLKDHYELEGICGYIHGVAEPENHCKHVLWVKQLKEEVAALRSDKRELVEACEKAKFLIESPATSFMDSIRKRAMGTLEVINELIAKHREK